MNLDIDPRDRPDVEDPRAQPVPDARTKTEALESSRERELTQLRGYRYQISPAESSAMREIGRFRTIVNEDLARYLYSGKTGDMREDLDSLRAQGLIQQRTVRITPTDKKLDLIVLTKRGKEILERDRQANAHQQFYAGFVKPAELAHDTAIYRMYQAEAARIERGGGMVRRVVLDYELKQKVYRPLAKVRTKVNLAEYARRQAEVAKQNQLKVVRGRILLPDLRIEYQARSGGSAHVDLELATHHYRGAHMRGKAEAGFKLYAPKDSAERLTAALDPDLMAEIFSF